MATIKSQKNNQPDPARRLNLEEIKALPKATVVWYSSTIKSDEGIIYYSAEPALICVPGNNGIIIGGNAEYTFDRVIDDTLLDDPNIAFWDREPDRSQMSAITEEEFNDIHGSDMIVLKKLAAAITSKGMTFEKFCKCSKLNLKRFMEAMFGNREFNQLELETISAALDIEETDEMLFSERLHNVVDIATGRKI